MTQAEERQGVNGFPDDEGPAATFQGPLAPVLAAFLGLVVLGGTIDLILDRPASWLSLHVAFEVAMVLVSLGFAVALFNGWRRTAAELGSTRESLEVSRRDLAARVAERDDWRRRAEGALASLSTAIDEQFDAWKLTRAEREVALMLLKGDGHKQAAARLGRSERTVRQHAVEVYRKSGLQGRAELAAFFLQDLGGPGERP
jgi:DNA-binding CsgD family transcriptional regulator